MGTFVLVSDFTNGSLHIAPLSFSNQYDQFVAVPGVNTTKPKAVGYDPIQQKIYWVAEDSSANVIISRISLDGTQQEMLIGPKG